MFKIEKQGLGRILISNRIITFSSWVRGYSGALEFGAHPNRRYDYKGRLSFVEKGVYVKFRRYGS